MDIHNIDASSTSCNNPCSCLRCETVNSITQFREDTTDGIQVESSNRHDVELNVSVNNLRVGLRWFSKDDVITNDLEGFARCLDHTIQGDNQLVILNDEVLTFNSKWELLSRTVKLTRDIVDLLNNRSQNFLRVSQSLLTEENFGVVEG